MELQYEFENGVYYYEPTGKEIGDALLNLYGADMLVKSYITDYYPRLSKSEKEELEEYYGVKDARDIELSSRDSEFFEDIILETMIDNADEFESDLKDYFEDIAIEEYYDSDNIEDLEKEWLDDYYRDVL